MFILRNPHRAYDTRYLLICTDDFSQKIGGKIDVHTLKLLNSVCPVSVAVADEHIRMTNGKSLKEVLELEFRAMRFQQR